MKRLHHLHIEHERVQQTFARHRVCQCGVQFPQFLLSKALVLPFQQKLFQARHNPSSLSFSFFSTQTDKTCRNRSNAFMTAAVDCSTLCAILSSEKHSSY